MSRFFCVVLLRVGRGLTIGQSHVKGGLPKRLKGIIISEVNYES